MHVALLSLLLSLNTDPPPDTLVFCPPSFAPALRPWVAHRESQGHRIRILPNGLSSYSIRETVRNAYASGTLKYVVLVGDALPFGHGNSYDRQRTTPTFRTPARVVSKWGPEIEIAADNWYADVDDDQLPDVAIGRLTADTPDQLAAMIKKTLAYEQQQCSGEWQRRISFVAGLGDFGPIIDTVIERATKKFLTEGIPPSYATSMTYGNWRSPYCPDPRHFHETARERLNEGCLFWIYIGHGQRRHLDRLRLRSATRPIMTAEDALDLRRTGGSPIAIFLSCYSGAYDGQRDCLAEEFLRAPEGPVALLAGSRVTMPYAMAVFGNELMHEYFVSRRQTLGQLVLHSKRRMAAPVPEDHNRTADTRQWLDALGAMFGRQTDLLDEERLEHVQIFNLLGDPLLRLRHPLNVQLATAEYTHAGETLLITGSTPIGGELIVELVCRRDQTRNIPPLRTTHAKSDAEMEAYTRTYQLANNRKWATVTRACQAGPFEVRLQVPPEARGPCYVRAFVEDSEGHALGAHPVLVKGPRRIQRLADKAGDSEPEPRLQR